MIVFKPLSEEAYAKIAKLNLEELRSPLAEKKLDLNIYDDVYAAVAKKAFGGKFGGRDIRRVIRSDIEDKIAEMLIENSEKQFSKVEITASDDEIKVELK